MGEENKSIQVVTQEDTFPMRTPIENKLAEMQHYITSGLLPSTVKSAEAALVIIQYGKELGFSPMQSFNSIYVVKNRPSLSTAAMSALLRQGGVKWKTIKDYSKVLNEKGEVKDIETTIRFFRDGVEDDITFSLSEANTAGLMGSEVWKKYPKIMLYWRCFSIGARRVASDLIMGLYTIEEAAEIEKVNIDITDDGNVTIK